MSFLSTQPEALTAAAGETHFTITHLSARVQPRAWTRCGRVGESIPVFGAASEYERYVNFDKHQTRRAESAYFLQLFVCTGSIPAASTSYLFWKRTWLGRVLTPLHHQGRYTSPVTRPSPFL